MLSFMGLSPWLRDKQGCCEIAELLISRPLSESICRKMVTTGGCCTGEDDPLRNSLMNAYCDAISSVVGAARR